MTRARVVFALVALCASTASAQLPQARLYSVFPPGVQVGSTVDVTVTGGEDIDELSGLHFSHPGITAAPKLQEVDGQPRPVDNVFVVSAAANVPPGIYEVVAQGRFGASNPRRFAVGLRPESIEAEPNNEPANATPLTIDRLVNARMDAATDIDWYRFTAEAGQRLVIDCAALAVDSRMSCALELYDASGRRIARARGSRFGDAALPIDVPAAGEYTLKVFDHTFRGGSEYFYRLAVHTGPQIAFILPPAGVAGSSGAYAIFGYNLPGGERTESLLNGIPLERLETTITLPSETDSFDADEYTRSVAAVVDGFTFRLQSPHGPSNPVRIALSEAPVLLEQEPNDEPQQAQAIAVPAEVGGQFAAPGDVDYVSFEARAGEVICIETFGERIGSGADPYLTVDQVTVDANGVESSQRLTAQDDIGTSLYPNVFDTQSDDAYFRLQVPADGTYRVSVRHRAWETEGDPARVYRLVIRRESPDFRVVAVPLSPAPGQPFPIGLRQGDHFAVNLLAFRQDGFNGAIEVTAENLPPGVSCPGTVIGPNQTSAPLVFTAAVDAPPTLQPVTLRARATLYDGPSIQALETAKTAARSAAAALPGLKSALEKATSNVELGTAARDAAKAASEANPSDQALAQALQLAQQALDTALAAHQQAEKACADGEQALAQAVAARQQAEQTVAEKARALSREVRPGIVAWSGNGAATSRLAAAICLSIMPEAAPFQVSTNVDRVVLYQSGQLLIPATLEKRNGFDDAVAVNFTGLPNNTNIDVANGKFEKGETSKVLRLFAKENATPGIYTVWLSTQAQVSYARNPERAARLQAEHDTIAAEAKSAAEAAAQTTQAKTEAAQTAAAAAEALTLAQNEKTAADTALQTAQAARQQAQDALKAAEQNVATAEAARTKAEQALATDQQLLAGAEKVVETAAQLVKSAQAALDADQQNETLKQQKAAADAAFAAAQQARDTSQEAIKAAEAAIAAAKDQLEKSKQGQAAAKQALTAAEEAVAQAEKTAAQRAEELASAESASKAAAEAQAAAEKAEQEATARSAALETRRQAAEKAAGDAAKAAAPQNKNFTPPSSAVVVEVRAAPIKLAASVPDSGNLKRGGSIQIKVTVTRQNGFAGPVALCLPLPPGVTGLSTDNPTIAADQTEGVLTVSAAADATLGGLANLVVQGAMEFDGTATVDAPISLTVSE